MRLRSKRCVTCRWPNRRPTPLSFTCRLSASISLTRWDRPRVSTRTGRCRTHCCGSALASSRLGRSRRARNPAIRNRGSSAWTRIRGSSTGSASTMTALPPSTRGSPRGRTQKVFSASISEPIATPSTEPRTICGWSRPSPRSQATSPSMFHRRTRRACAICSRQRRSKICLRGCSMHASEIASAPA